jgi:hypothetical protein
VLKTINIISFNKNTYTVVEAMSKTNHLKPPRINTYRKPARNSPAMNTYKKPRGVGGTPTALGLRPLLAVALLLALFSLGCAVPLGPGFRLRSRQMLWADLPAQPTQVRVRVADVLQNIGNRDLTHLDLSLAAPAAVDRSSLAVRVNGQVVPASPVSSEDPASPLRVRFDPAWPPRQRREVAFEYAIQPDPVRRTVAAATPGGFYLADPNALPLWRVPVGVFANAELLSRDERFEVSLPADFRVLASGREQRRRSADGTVLHRFRTSGRELPSYVIAGRYQEHSLRTAQGNVVFWTFQPLDPAAAQMAAERLAASAATFARLFGPLPLRGPAALYVVETPAGVIPPGSLEGGISAASFPRGVLLDARAFTQEIASEPVLRLAEAELVRRWFGWRLPLRPEMETLMGPGLGLFAVALAANDREGPAARRSEIARLLAAYDRARVSGGEGSILRPPAESTPQQRVVNAYKAALFLAALDDLAGQQNFESAVRRLQDAMAGRGLSLSLDDLRSSLELSAGTALADVFRLWINRPGVPDDFRARYSQAAAAAPSRLAVPMLKPAQKSVL